MTRRRTFMVEVPLLAMLVSTSACFLFAPKTNEPEREYTAAEKELRADYKLAKDSNDRNLSSCIWDYSLLLEKLEKGPEARLHDKKLQSDSGCQTALEKGTSHPELANKYIAKFAELEPARAELAAGSKALDNEEQMEQCMVHVRKFEEERDGINVAAFLTRCIEMFEKIPEEEREAIPDSRAVLDEARTRHAKLLADFERMKKDPGFTALVDDHLRLQDEEATLELRIHELEQYPSSAQRSEAISVANGRLRKVQDEIKDNLAARKPYYEKYGVVLQ